MAQKFSGEKLRDFRRTAGISRERFAVLIDRSYQSLRHYESGKTTPPPDIGERIADVLGIPVEALYDEASNG